MSKRLTPEQRLAIAFSLARHGFHVFPVSARKIPLVKAWESAATTDPEQIATWWTLDHPDALIGYATGASGVVGVDLDVDKPYPEHHERAGQMKGAGLDNLTAADLEPPETGLTYATPSGGRHLVYRAPEGRALTIAQDVPVPGVDIRAGNGFLIYYGRRLKAAPDLAPAPEWALVDAREKAAGRGADLGLEAWLQRVKPGKPSPDVKAAARLIAEHGTDHGTMLRATGELVRLGASGEPGAGKALLKARERYTRHYPDHARHFDEATAGSVKHHGAPPVTIELSAAERKAIARRNRGGAMTPADERDDESDGAPAAADDLTDAALAEQVAAELAGRFAYGRGFGLMRYARGRWAPVDETSLIEACRLIMRRVRADETRAAIMRGDKKREAEARALEQRTRIVAVARLAGGIMAEREAVCDDHPDLLNTPSGVVDLRTKELRPHDAALMLTKMTAVDYDPDADRSLWLRALEALPSKTAAWLQVRLGQGLTGFTPDDDRLLIFEGGGENGKTTILHAPRVVLGDYAVTVPDRLFMANPGDHPTELTVLMGARFAVVEELSEGRNLNVKRLKDSVGTPELTARRMRQDNVTWRSTHCLYLSTNYRPIVAETDHGTWRRLLLVHFPYRFVDADELKKGKSKRDRLGDPSIKAQLAETADPGVLAWLVDGAAAWYAAGRRMPPVPKRVARDTHAWRMDADPVLGYVAERLVTGEKAEGYAVASADLAADFNEYIEARGHHSWSSSTINSRFGGHESLRDVERKPVRFGPKWTPSRPSSAYKPLPQVTNAWVNLRFAEEPARVPPSREVADWSAGTGGD